MICGALGELVSIGAVLPFLAVVSNPQATMEYTSVKVLTERLGINTPIGLAIAATACFAIAVLVATAARLFLVYASQSFVYGVSKDLSVSIFRRTLHQPYSYHIARNSSELLAAIGKAQLVSSQFLMPMMQAATATVIATFILAGLIFIDPLVAVGSGVGFAAIYLTVMRTTRSMMLENGRIIAQAQSKRLKAASEGLGGIRDVLLDRSQNTFIARFAETEAELRNAQSVNNFIAQAPRFIVEGMGLVLVAALAIVIIVRDGGLVTALPVLGTLALGAQRLLPLTQQAYSGWAALLTAGPMLADILDILRLPNSQQYSMPPATEKLPFHRDIVFNNVGFSYPQTSQPTLSGINLAIPRGTRVGVAGRTGSGKSTLMDMVLGLLSPGTGQILVDGVELSDINRAAWQARIAHVPQSIYLSDASIAENIAFGLPTNDIDHELVVAAASQAKLASLIEFLPQGYRTLVGERGVRLSGGQRQRIGIARALYKQADVLVFDEATNALHSETESEVMSAIAGLGREMTIFIIAHNLSLLEGCDIVIALDAGRVKSIQSPMAGSCECRLDQSLKPQ